jgi:hypothetical protein
MDKPCGNSWDELGEIRGFVALTYCSVAISVHELAERCVSLDFELNDCVVLAQHLQVDVLTFSSLQNEKCLVRILSGGKE